MTLISFNPRATKQSECTMGAKQSNGTHGRGGRPGEIWGWMELRMGRLHKYSCASSHSRPAFDPVARDSLHACSDRSIRSCFWTAASGRYVRVRTAVTYSCCSGAVLRNRHRQWVTVAHVVACIMHGRRAPLYVAACINTTRWSRCSSPRGWGGVAHMHLFPSLCARQNQG